MPSARPHIILIDGPSGSGKSTLATTMGDALGATVLRLDDVYPGWGGLIAGRDTVIDTVIEPIARGESGRVQLWDWLTNSPGETRDIDAVSVLIVEGCGIITERSRALADTTIWLDCAKQIRGERVRRRDPASFDAFRVEWEAQVDRHIAENDPIRVATVRINGS